MESHDESREGSEGGNAECAGNWIGRWLNLIDCTFVTPEGSNFMLRWALGRFKSTTWHGTQIISARIPN